MAKHVAGWLQADSLEVLLRHQGLSHLRVRRYGVLLIVESGTKGDTVPHARFRRESSQSWILELPTHTGAWAMTGFRGSVKELLEQLASAFPWVLAPVT